MSAEKPTYGNILDRVGNTPIVEITRFDTGPCRLFAKMENMNPGGSVKDRIALHMVEAAEARGDLMPGGTIVEATSGNTGLGLALVATLKGYRCIIVIPDKMSEEKIQALRAYGAEVHVTRSDVLPPHPQNYQTMARKFAEEIPGALYIGQHYNPDNPVAHYESTGPEIWHQMGGDLDAIIGGMGTAGTLTGLGRYFNEIAPHIQIVLADPEGSMLADYVWTGEEVEPGAWLVEGIGEDEIPPIGDMDRLNRAWLISDEESLTMARELARREGILAGSSTGTILATALRWCREQSEPKRVVMFVCDTGDRYLSKMYDDRWMAEQGFLPRTRHGDLRDLIARPHSSGQDVTIPSDAAIAEALTAMRREGVSQLPVVDTAARGKPVVGLVDEGDLLLAVYNNEAGFSRPVSEAMTTNLETLRPGAPVSEVQALFARGMVALIADEDGYYGLVTRADLLNHLRRRARDEVPPQAGMKV